MTRLRRLSWSLFAIATAAVLFVTPQAQAYHLPGFGHDNLVAAGFGTGTVCDVGDGCLISENGNNSYNAVGLIGRHTSFNGGGGPGWHSAGVYGLTNSQGVSAVGVYGQVVPTGQPGADSAGVRGDNTGIYGSAAGVLGWNSGSGLGVRGYSEYGVGVSGYSNSTVSGSSGVAGTSNAANTLGVYGASDNGIGVQASSSSGTALQVNGRSKFTGQPIFQNGVAVTGRATFSRSGVLTAQGGTSSMVKTGVSLTPSSYVLATMQTNTPGVSVHAAVPNTAASSITIYFDTTAPAGTKVAWFVVN
jgi:hypothetical protein